MPEKYACATCEEYAEEVDHVGDTCIRCFEIEHQLEKYIKNPKGLAFVESALATHRIG